MASSSESGSESDDYKKKKRKSKKKKVRPQAWALYILVAKSSRIRMIFQAIKPLLVRYLVSVRNGNVTLPHAVAPTVTFIPKRGTISHLVTVISACGPLQL